MKTYRVTSSRFMLAVTATAFLSYFPIISIFEFSQSRSTYFEAIGKGSKKIPVWQLDASIWICAVFLIYNFCGPILFNYFREFEFSITDHNISTKQKSIEIAEIDSISRVGWKNSIKILSTSGDYILLPSVFGKIRSDEIENDIRQIIYDRPL